MSIQLNEKRLLIRLKMHEYNSMYFASLFRDFYRVTEINYDMPLKESLIIALMNEDILIHTCNYEKRTHRIAKEYYIEDKQTEEFNESITIIGLFLSIIIIQEYKTVENINKYLTEIFNIDIDIKNPDPSKGSATKFYLDKISLFIRDKIIFFLNEQLLFFNENGFNNIFLNLYDDVRDLKKETRKFIEIFLINKNFFITLKSDFEKQSKITTILDYRYDELFQYGIEILNNVKNNITKYDSSNYFNKNKQDKRIILQIEKLCKKILSYTNSEAKNNDSIKLIKKLSKICDEIIYKTTPIYKKIKINSSKTAEKDKQFSTKITRDDDKIILDLLEICEEIKNNINLIDISTHLKENAEYNKTISDLLKFCEKILININYKKINDYLEKNNKNGEIVEELLLNTCNVDIEQISILLNKLDIKLSNKDIKDINNDLDNKKLAFREIFTSNKCFTQIKSNNHYMSFILNCSIHLEDEKYVLEEYRYMLITSIILKYICIKYKRKITHFNSVLKELRILEIDTTTLESFYKFLDSDNFKYIEYALLSHYFDINYEQLKKYKNKIDNNKESFREDTFIKFKNNIFPTIKIFKNIFKNNSI